MRTTTRRFSFDSVGKTEEKNDKIGDISEAYRRRDQPHIRGVDPRKFRGRPYSNRPKVAKIKVLL